MYLLLLLTLGLRLWLPGWLRPDPEVLLEEDADFIAWLAEQDSIRSCIKSKDSGSGESKSRLAPKRTNYSRKKTIKSIQDLNLVSALEIQEVRGIGPVLSTRIINFRDALGGFLHESQLLDVYGLPPEVAREAMLYFRVLNPPNITPININTATAEDLSGLVYLNWKMAREIVHHRTAQGNFTNTAELAELLRIPKDRIDRIALYLQF